MDAEEWRRLEALRIAVLIFAGRPEEALVIHTRMTRSRGMAAVGTLRRLSARPSGGEPATDADAAEPLAS